MTHLPDFIIIGGMKCMTSTLHEQLARQDGIRMSDPKEPCYFSDSEVFSRGPSWYSNLWGGRQGSDLCGESSTHYTKFPKYPETAARISDAVPDVKLIYVVRHPVERIVSHYVHEWSMGTLPSGSPDSVVLSDSAFVDYSRYAYQLLPYLKHFDPRQIRLVFFDHLVERPQAVLEQVCSFVGYRGEPKWSSELQAQNAGAQRMRASAWRDSLAYAPGVNWVRRTVVPKSAREFVKSFWRMNQKPELHQTTIQELSVILDEDLAILSSWLGLGVNLTCANFHHLVEDFEATAHDLRKAPRSVSELAAPSLSTGR